MFEPADSSRSPALGFPRADSAETVSRQGRPAAADQAARAAGTGRSGPQRSPPPGSSSTEGARRRRPRLPALDLARRRYAPGRGCAAEDDALPTCCSHESCAPACTRIDLVQKRPGARPAAGQVPCPARHPRSASSARPDGGADALLFVRRLQVPVVMTTSTRRGLTPASATARRDRQAGVRGRISPDEANRQKA